MTAFLPVCLAYPLSKIIWFAEMKVHACARDMNWNRKYTKKYVEI